MDAPPDPDAAPPASPHWTIGSDAPVSPTVDVHTPDTPAPTAPSSPPPDTAAQVASYFASICLVDLALGHPLPSLSEIKLMMCTAPRDKFGRLRRITLNDRLLHSLVLVERPWLFRDLGHLPPYRGHGPLREPFTALTFVDLIQHLQALRPKARGNNATCAAVSSAMLDFRCRNPCDGVRSPLLIPSPSLDQTQQKNGENEAYAAKALAYVVRTMMFNNPQARFHAPEFLQWNRVPFYGFHVRGNADNLKDAFVEIQYKRVSGADLPLAKDCGVDCGVFSVLRAVPVTMDQNENKDGGFSARRVEKSFVYLVRMVGSLTEPGRLVNGLQGPPKGTAMPKLLCMGGWVVPPLEERIALLNPQATNHQNYSASARTGAHSKPPPHLRRRPPAPSRPPLNCALPVADNYADPELWLQPADPAEEDVLWMAWKLLTGTKYRGFLAGTGPGIDPYQAYNRVHLCAYASNNPFQSPSDEVIQRSWGIYQETKTACKRGKHVAGHSGSVAETGSESDSSGTTDATEPEATPVQAHTSWQSPGAHGIPAKRRVGGRRKLPQPSYGVGPGG